MSVLIISLSDPSAGLPQVGGKGTSLARLATAGHAEGRVRIVNSPEEGRRLQTGGSLSHAAIVARELGIPAVVGCGDATMLLKTGDFVRVDGSAGSVEVIERTG